MKLEKLLKGETIAYVTAIGLAFQLFQNLDVFLDFCRWAQPLVYYWRLYLYGFFDLILFWLPLQLPYVIKDSVTVLILFFGVFLRVRAQAQKIIQSKGPSDANAYWRNKLAAYSKTALFPTLFILFIFLTPVFGWNEQDGTAHQNISSRIDNVMSFAPMTLRGLVAVSVVAALIVTDEAKILGKITKALFGRHLWRTATFIVALVTLNFIGLYADKIRAIKLYTPAPGALESAQILPKLSDSRTPSPNVSSAL